MKNLTTIILILLSSNPMLFLTSQEGFVYKALDQAVITLLQNAHSSSMISKTAQLDEIIFQLENTNDDLINKPTPHFDKSQYYKYCKGLTHLLARYIKKNNADKIEFFCWELLMENNQLRQCMGISNYPLDPFLETYEAMKKLDKTINDPMMDLLEWNEFEDVIEDFINSWQVYDCFDDKNFKIYFPKFDQAKHDTLKGYLNFKMDHFLLVLNEENQGAFKDPSYEIIEILNSILHLYHLPL